jgi:hypothetical protein
MPRPRRQEVLLEGHFLSFADGKAQIVVHRERAPVTGPVSARALRWDLNKSFLPEGRNRAKAERLGFEPHISFLVVRHPGNYAPIDTDKAAAFEVVA